MAAPKPQPVVISEYLMWSTLIIAAMIVAIDYEHMQAIMDAALEKTKSHGHISILWIIGFAVLFQVGLILIIYSGRRWGRALLCVSIVLSFPQSIPVIKEEYHRSAILAGLSACQLMLPILAYALLFSTEARDWFEECKTRRNAY